MVLFLDERVLEYGIVGRLSSMFLVYYCVLELIVWSLVLLGILTMR